MTGLRSTPPMLVTLIVNVTLVEGAPLLGETVLLTTRDGGLISRVVLVSCQRFNVVKAIFLFACLMPQIHENDECIIRYFTHDTTLVVSL